MIRRNVRKLNYEGTCAIFTSGTYDPWSAMGFTDQSQTSDANTVFLIESKLHALNFSVITLIVVQI